MNQNSNYPRFGQQQPHQYGMPSFDQPARKGFVEKVFGPSVARTVASPLFSTAALLLAGVAFAAVIMAVYPDSSSEGEVPVVKADTLAFKDVPDEPGGMMIENRDSTIFSTMNDAEGEEPAPIENLLEDDQSDDKLAAFAREVEASLEDAGDAATEAAEDTAQDISTMAEAESEAEPVTLQKIAKQTETTNTEQVAQVMAPKPPPPAEEKVRPEIKHKAGESPETLEFVKNVLDKKDGKTVASASDVATQTVAAVQPAAGDATRDFTITPGSHYVQLGSVKSLDGASGEWGRLQKEFSEELAAAPHRVQAAELGDRGTFYRIQAGPMSKDSASAICDSIKAQKPDGCLIVQ